MGRRELPRGPGPAIAVLAIGTVVALATVRSQPVIAAVWAMIAVVLLVRRAARAGRGAAGIPRARLRELTDVASAAAGGDLRGDVAVTAGGELGELQSALAKALSVHRATIARIDAAATDLSNAGIEMARTADEAGHAVSEVSLAISSISEGAGHQVSLVGETTKVVSDIECALGDAVDFAVNAQRQSAETERLSEDGVERANEVRDAMQEIRQTAMTTAAAVRSLGAKSEDIDQIVQTISGIAQQTNMLALNASIEAARAGEQGKGFSNVADEVRLLADDAHGSAEKIARLVHDIQAQTDSAVGAMEASIDHVERGAETINRNRRIFTDIGTAVHELHESSGMIAELASGTTEGISTLRSQMAGVSEVAEQSSAATGDVSSSTAQTSAAAVSVSVAADGVARTAAQLAELAGRFQLPEHAAA